MSFKGSIFFHILIIRHLSAIYKSGGYLSATYPPANPWRIREINTRSYSILFIKISHLALPNETEEALAHSKDSRKLKDSAKGLSNARDKASSK